MPPRRLITTSTLLLTVWPNATCRKAPPNAVLATPRPRAGRHAGDEPPPGQPGGSLVLAQHAALWVWSVAAGLGLVVSSSGQVLRGVEDGGEQAGHQPLHELVPAC